jgi:hypothetical protein
MTARRRIRQLSYHHGSMTNEKSSFVGRRSLKISGGVE